ncbi:NUDIX hydrolase [Streptomyces aquilus]|uniref:NUDIX hydrolase n=1 Tax=Streptomyces aquilus TaxID=2548456 RepID=A0A3S9I0I8_9ACTN|nr:NUDIX hydrolase [Streptomyces aquilus]AZP17842.1 NUDIX hydrolase [Streptomyces aquilus]
MNSDGRWHKRGSRTLFAGGPNNRIRLAVDDAVRPDGATVAYPHVAAPDSVRVLAVHRGQVAMVTQHHYLHGSITDLPGGLVDEGEAPEDAARRELAEEAGLQATWLFSLGAVATARATSTEKAHLYLAHGCTPGPTSQDAGESVRAHWSSWHELAEPDVTALQAVMPFPLGDAASLAAVQRNGVALRAIGGTLPTRGDDLLASAWAAYTVAALRDPIADDRLSLVWLDLAIGGFAEGAVILTELEAAYEGLDNEQAWEHAAQQFWSLAQGV